MSRDPMTDESGSPDPPSKRPPSTTHAYLVLARRFMILGAVLLLVLLVVAELRRSGINDVGGTTTANYRAVARFDGRTAPGFEMQGLDGRTLSLVDYRDQVVVLNFWATWCAPCRLEAPALQAASEDYSGRGLQFIGVNYRDDAAAARASVVQRVRITADYHARARGKTLLAFIDGTDTARILKAYGKADSPSADS